MTAPNETLREKLGRYPTENPRDELALRMIAAWCNVTVDQLPLSHRGHTCEATKTAWGRVAQAALDYLQSSAIADRDATIAHLQASLEAEHGCRLGEDCAICEAREAANGK